MKDIKTFVIGFLTCACLFLIMGQIDKTEKNVMEDIKTLMTQNGRYQGMVEKDHRYLIDTRTGELFIRKELKWHSISGVPDIFKKD